MWMSVYILSFNCQCYVWKVVAAPFWSGLVTWVAMLDMQQLSTEMCTIQAGVAMGLAKTVAVRFPEWGPDFATLMVSVAAMQPVLQQCSEGFSFM